MALFINGQRTSSGGGNRNQGNRNQGNRNQGNRNQGNRNTGNRNAGNQNRNQGNRNQGNRNQGNKGNKGPKTATPAVNPLLDPTQTLSGTRLQQAAQGVADAQTVGPISELAKQVAANRQQTQGVQTQDFNYYLQLANAAKDAVGQQQANDAGLNTTLQGVGQQTQATLGQLGQQALGGANARFQAQGLGGDTTAQIGAQTAGAQGVAAQNAQTFQQQGATQGAANVAQGISNRQAVQQAGQEQLSNVALKGEQANEPLNAKIAGLQASRGALYSNALGSIRQSERNYQIAQEGLGQSAQKLNLTAQQNSITDALKKLGINQAAAAAAARTATSAANNQRTTKTSAANNAANNATSVANNQRTIAAENQRAAKAGSGSGGGVGGRGGLTVNEQNKSYGDVRTAMTLIRQGQAAGHPEALIRQALTDGSFQKGVHRIDPILVNAAYEILGWGHITPATARQMFQMGLRGAPFGNPRPRPAPGPSGVPTRRGIGPGGRAAG